MRSTQSQMNSCTKFRVVFVLMLWSCCSHRCWSYSPLWKQTTTTTNNNKNNIKNKFHTIICNTVVTTLAILGSTLSSSNAIDDPILNISEETLRQGLSQPTKLQPQIQLDSTTTRITPTITKREKLPILQGMVYLLNERGEERPDYADVLVLTVGTESDPVIAGAKYPIAKARLPFQFRMYDANVLPTKTLPTNDEFWIVKAKVCPSTEVVLPCSDQSSTFLATTRSKLLTNIPGITTSTNNNDNNDATKRIQTSIRTPVALPLAPNPK